METPFQAGLLTVWLDMETLLPIAISIPEERGLRTVPPRTIRTLNINAAPTIARPEPTCVQHFLPE